MSVPVPQIVSWNLTRQCNLACGHCYLDAVRRRSESPQELTVAQAIDVIEQLAQLAPGAMVILTGGEPLLRRDVAAIVAHAAARGLMPVIGTNGTLLGDFRAEELKRAGAMGVGISIDSATPEFHDGLRGMPGAWQLALEGVRAAKKAGLGILVQTTLFEENRRDLDRVAELAEREGAMALNLYFLVCTGRGATQTDLSSETYEQTLRDVAELQKRRPRLMIRTKCAPYLRRMLGLRAGESREGFGDWSSACLAGRSYFRITPQGKVTPCPYLPEIAGDLRTTPLAEIWQAGAPFLRLRQELPGGKCGDCDFRASCGGCRARAFAVHGDLMAEDPKCGYRRPPESVPESVAQFATERASPCWTPEAQALLERIPGFVRERVRANLEREAEKVRVERIDPEFMRAHRPHALPFGRP